MLRKITIVLVLVHVFVFVSQAQKRGIAILDLTARNGQTGDSRLFSVKQMVQVAGVHHFVTTEPDEAFEYSMVISTSQLKKNTLIQDEKYALEDYVLSGGILIVPRMLDDDLNHVFGIDSYEKFTTNHRIRFNEELDHPAFKYIDEPEEWEISMGKLTIEEIFNSYAYTLNSGIPLAHYETEEVAIVYNEYGEGQTYSFGFAWKDMILRALINRDYEAQRISSNGFEPTMDVLMLMIRSIYQNKIRYAVHKHTSLANSSSTLMITHDIDSRTAVDSLIDFTKSEQLMGITATYNVTVRYFADEAMSDFYQDNETKVHQAINKGHVLGSHSVGHFRDFGDDDIFPIGDAFITKEDYNPYNDGQMTTGGNLFGECKVSKDVLEDNHEQQIRVFRSGHLAYNKYLVNVLDSLGYEYNSSFSANSVLTNFPYQNKKNRSFSGPLSNVYELPVSISDVFHSNPINAQNYLMKAETWLDVTRKIDANHAPTVLLIHPNRGYKLIGQEYYLARIPETMAIEEMSSFGDYWRKREAFDFTTHYDDSISTLVVTIDLDDYFIDENISMIINNGQDLENIIVKDTDGNTIEFQQGEWEQNDIILYQYDRLAVHMIEQYHELPVKVYPNPASRHINVDIDLDYDSNVDINMYDISGRLVYHSLEETRNKGRKFIHIDLPSQIHTGIYFLSIDAGVNGKETIKIMVR